MDMIRWLASNIVVQVAWGLGLLAVLLAAIFGGGKSSESHADVDTKNVEEKVLTAEVAAAPVAVAAATTAAVSATEEKVVEPVQALVDTTAVAAEATTTEAEAVEPVTATEATAEVEASVAEEVAAVEEAPLETSSVTDKSTEDLLMMAREAYWNNGLDEAAELYGVLIEREPTVIEHKGELGNVLWKQGYPSKAAELYAEIAEPMIEKGNGERVSNMVGFIGLFYPERAATIRELLAK